MDTNLLTNIYYSQKQTYDIPIALVSFPISRLLTNIETPSVLGLKYKPLCGK